MTLANEVSAKASHRFGRPLTQNRQRSQLGVQESDTGSPTACRVTPGPTASMTPAPSWPSTIGTGGGQLPFRAERSLWQTLLLVSLTITSPGPGSAISISSITSGSLTPYITAARIVRPSDAI